MNKSRMLTIFFSLAIVVFCINAYADDTSHQIASLEQKAELINNQINQAQSQCGNGLESQLKPLATSIENLVQQRAQLGAQISQLESQVEDLKKNSRANCARHVKQQEEQLVGVKQEIANLVAKQKAEMAQKAETAQKANEVTGSPATPAVSATAPEKHK